MKAFAPPVDQKGLSLLVAFRSHRSRPEKEETRRSGFLKGVFSDSLVANVDHAGLNRTDLNHVARVGSMDHLAVADVDAAMG